MKTNVARLALLALLAVPGPAYAQATVGLIVNDAPEEGLTLFSPTRSLRSYLINNDGLVVHAWTGSLRPAFMAYLLENGDLLRTARLNGVSPNFTSGAGRGGRVEQLDWDGALVWEFEYSSDDYLPHHDIEPLPNGNVLLIAWDYMSALDAIANGKNPALVNSGLWIDHVIEVEPTPPVGGDIVWEWHARDHLIQDFDPTRANFGPVEDHPERIDFNYGGAGVDFTHFNGIAYDAELDQIILSVRGMSEVWIIDHSTTIAEAAGHAGGVRGMGGDLIYRWGNPQVYRRGTSADQQLNGQHDAQWIAQGRPGAGNILVYNNNAGFNVSSVDEFVPPVNPDGSYTLDPGEPFGPASAAWRFFADPPESQYSPTTSGAQRLPDGNTLICAGAPGHFYETETDSDVVWEYINPVTMSGSLPQGAAPVGNPVFKIRRYPFDFPGFAGRDLTPGEPVELFSSPFPVPADSLYASRSSADGSAIDVEWNGASCPSYDYNLLYGSLLGVDSYALTGARCAIGVGGGFPWFAVPGSDLFFLIVGTDDTGVYESSWGLTGSGDERFGTKASFSCGTTTKIPGAVCP